MKPSVVYISIDALHTEVILNPDKFGIKIPYLRKLPRESVYAKDGVYGIYPTLTYPCHATMFTGVEPKTHNLYNNIYFDPEDKHKQAWKWFDPKKRKLENLWSKAKEVGYVTANAFMPVAVGADIDYNIIEYWRDNSEYNNNLFNCLCSPSWIVDEMEKDIGFIPGLRQTEKEDDVSRGKAGLWLLENKLNKSEKPFFLSQYFAAYDGKCHDCKTYSKEAFEALEAIDDMCRQIEEKAREIAGDNLIICIVSDHGMADVKQTIQINSAFLKANLIESDDFKKIKSWQAYCHSAHGMAEIKLNHREDEETYSKVKKLLLELAADKSNGIKKVYDREGIKQLGSFLDADFALEAELSYRFDNQLEGDIKSEESKCFATHGYSPDYNEMRALFSIKGKGIPAGKAVSDMNLIDYAPTLAAVMGFSLPKAEGKNIL